MKTVFHPSQLRALFLFCALLLTFAGVSQAQALGSIKGKVFEDKNKTLPAAGADVVAKKEGAIIRTGITKENGEFELSLLPAGKYTIVINLYGTKTEIQDVQVSVGESVKQDFIAGGVEIDGGQIFGDKVFTVDPGTPVTIDYVDFKNTGGRNATDMVAAFSSEVYQPDQGSPLNISGSRTNATVTYVDGVKMIGEVGLPAEAIDQVVLHSGGMSAEYGDATGGVISITTRNPGMRGWVGPPRSKKVKKAKKENSIGNNLETELVG